MKNKIYYPALFLVLLTVLLLAASPAIAGMTGDAAEAFAPSGPAAGTGFSVKLNGRPVIFDVSPRLEDGRFLVPLRPVLEAMGAKVTWYSDTGTAVACLPGATLVVTNGSQYAGLNGQGCQMPLAAAIDGGRFIVPLEIILQATGAQSGWDSETQTLSLFLKETAGFPGALLDLQRDIQNELDRVDRDLFAAAGELARTGLDGEEARRILSGLAARYPYVVDACTVDKNGKIVAVEPAAYHEFAGSDISGQEQVRRLWETGRPVISSVFMAVEGFPAVALEWPVFPVSYQHSYHSLEGSMFNRQNELIGSVSLLIKPEQFFASFALPELQGQQPEMMVMQKDGYIVNDSDSSQIGRNTFTDPLYQDYTGLLTMARRTAADRTGVGTYVSPDQTSQKQVVKRSIWTTVGLHGTEWRLIMNYAVDGDTQSGKSAPALEISPLQALAGDPWKIKVSGLAPGAPVTLVAEQQDGSGIKWESHAVFHADQNGVVDPGVQAPVSGTYEGVDPAGLFWSLRPVAGVKPSGTFAESLEPQKITVSVEVEGERILAQEVERLNLLPGVRRVEVREAGVTGTLFIPDGEGRRPAIIVLGGSDGGTYEPTAAIYASHGYVTLALAYFGMEGLPDSLVNIPLETVERAIHWLEAHPRVDQDAIGVWGASKGAELALLAASHYPQIKAVVAKSPSAVVFQGISKDFEEEPQSSWTFRGEPVPYVPTIFPEELAGSYFAAVAKNEPWSTTPLYEYALQNREAVEKAAIKVENINGPVLLVSGGLDGAWPSGKLSEMIMLRLQEKGHPFPDERLNYPDAGHQISVPYSPTTVNWLTLPYGFIEDLGGSPEGNAAASMDSWPKIIDFIRAHLDK